ncbi:acyl CoA binding protein-domain-containing protein [Fennellomyces sp. T-0311]|nr:acyl CoA binding protein-domain-containing protein [Fennellomyces sp. T-0311]
MSYIPPHYSERYVNQRYNKALQIVQYLPASSSFQPTREEKLELYAYYKQVSHGNVNTPRPGLFDMVGRAKWDAWKKLEGIDRLEARYRYTETLLRSATEAYKKNIGRATAEQIIQAFALMQPSGDRDSEGDEVTDDTTHDEDDEDGKLCQETSSIASAEAEEQAYLLEVQANAAAPPQRRKLVSPRQQQQRRSWYDRAPSAASSMVTAPTGHSRATSPSNASPSNDRLLPHMIPQHERIKQRSFEEDSLDPWAQHPANALHNNSSSEEDATKQQRAASPRHPRLINQHRIPVQPSPVYSTSSSVTATPRHPSTLHNVYSSSNINTPSNRATPDPQYMSVVALGPATKRALESLQTEVVALNNRIDELRRELVVRDQRDAAAAAAAAANKKRPASGSTAASNIPRRSSNGSDDDISDGWKWVIKAAAKHAAVNLITVFALLLILYKRGSPVAYVITGQFSKFWECVRQRVLFQTVV